MLPKSVKYKIWLWIHDRLEGAWHWVYYHGVKPNAPPPVGIPGALYWSNEGIWRQNPDGSLTKLSGNIDLGESNARQSIEPTPQR